MKYLKIIIILVGFIFSGFTELYSTTSSLFIKNEKKVSLDTILCQYQYEPLLIELDSLRKQTKDQNGLIAELQSLDLDDFLNLQDTTIFGSNFKNMDLNYIAPRSRDYYLLIQCIHNLDCLISAMENMTMAQMKGVNSKLNESKGLIDEINSYATLEKGRLTNYLTEPQKQFFRDLVEKYNNLIDIMSPTQSNSGYEQQDN